MTRDEQVREEAQRLKVMARVSALKTLADDTTSLYKSLIAHKTPSAIARGYFGVTWLRRQCELPV